MDDNHFYFYLGQAFSVLFIIGSAWFTFKSDTTNNKWGVFFCSLALTLTNFCTAYHANEDSIRSNDTAIYYRNLHTDLMSKNIDSSHKIIDTLDSTINHSRLLIKQNNVVLDSQKVTVFKLNNQFNLSNKIQRTVTTSSKKLLDQIDSTRASLQDETNDGKRYVVLSISVTGHKRYDWNLYNPFTKPVFIHDLIITDYLKLGNCKIVNQLPVPKIDSACFFANSVFPLILGNDGAPFTLTQGVTDLTFTKPDLSLGWHLYLVQFTLKNRIYAEELVYYVDENKGVNQAARLLTLGTKSPIIYRLKSNNEKFDKSIDWDRSFPLVKSGFMLYRM